LASAGGRQQRRFDNLKGTGEVKSPGGRNFLLGQIAHRLSSRSLSLGDQIQKAKYRSGWRAKNVESRARAFGTYGVATPLGFYILCVQTPPLATDDSSIVILKKCSLPMIPGPVCRENLHSI
jgi:hypothetical protein